MGYSIDPSKKDIGSRLLNEIDYLTMTEVTKYSKLRIYSKLTMSAGDAVVSLTDKRLKERQMASFGDQMLKYR